MKWYFKIAGGHTHVRVFLNGAKCGDLCFRNEEFEQIRAQLSQVQFFDETPKPLITPSILLLALLMVGCAKKPERVEWTLRTNEVGERVWWIETLYQPGDTNGATFLVFPDGRRIPLTKVPKGAIVI